MATNQVITKSEQNIINNSVSRIIHYYKTAKKSIFQIAQEFYDLKKKNNVLYLEVKRELSNKGIMHNTTVKEMTHIAECRDGFLIKNQDKLPLSHSGLLHLSKELKNEKKFKSFSTHIKTNNLQNYTKLQLTNIFNDEKQFKKIESDFENDLFGIKSQVKTVLNEQKTVDFEKALTIEFKKSDLLMNKKKILNDFKSIQKIMSYAKFTRHGQFEKN